MKCPKCGQEAESRINNKCYCNYCGYTGTKMNKYNKYLNKKNPIDKKIIELMTKKELTICLTKLKNMEGTD